MPSEISGSFGARAALRAWALQFLLIVLLALAALMPLTANADARLIRTTTGEDGFPSNAATTTPINTSGGNLFVVGIWWGDDTPNTMIVTDNKGNTYSTAVGKFVNSNGAAMQVFYVADAKGGTGHTFTVTSSDVTEDAFFGVRIMVHEVAGVAGVNALDKTASTNNDTSGGSLSVGPVTAAAGGEYIFAMAAVDGTDTFTAGAPFTERITMSPNDYENQTQDYTKPTAGAVTATWTRNTANLAMAAMATFKARGSLVKPANNLGLVGYWSFNEGTGTVATDFSGNGNHGTHGNEWVSGKRGKALELEDGGVNAGAGSSLNLTREFTISAWIYYDEGDEPTNDPKTIVQKYGVGAGYGVFLGDTFENVISCDINEEANSVQSGAVISPKRWYHVTCVKEESQVSVYIDGALDFSNGDEENPSSSAGSPLYIADDGTNNMEGKIDEVRIYNRALGATEIARLGQAGLVKFTSSSVALQTGSTLANGLVGHWTMDGPDVTATVTDRSGSNNHGYFYNGATSSAKVIGKLGQALNFNGSTQYVNAGTNASLQLSAAMSICAWIKPDVVDGVIVARMTVGEVSPYLLQLLSGGSKPSFGWTDDGGTYEFYDVDADDVATVGEWSHICAVRVSNSSVLIYVNAESLSVTQTLEASITTTSGTTAIGKLGAAAGGEFDGLIDDVRIYNRPLTAAEVKQLYKLGAVVIRQ